VNLLRVVIFAICFKPLKERYPSLFDGARALEMINEALKEHA
jgi:hypothetical protein